MGGQKKSWSFLNGKIIVVRHRRFTEASIKKYPTNDRKILGGGIADILDRNKKFPCCRLATFIGDWMPRERHREKHKSFLRYDHTGPSRYSLGLGGLGLLDDLLKRPVSEDSGSDGSTYAYCLNHNLDYAPKLLVWSGAVFGIVVFGYGWWKLRTGINNHALWWFAPIFLGAVLFVYGMSVLLDLTDNGLCGSPFTPFSFIHADLGGALASEVL